mgnify:CR=1 FL=1|jgi:hypothetical protein
MDTRIGKIVLLFAISVSIFLAMTMAYDLYESFGFGFNTGGRTISFEEWRADGKNACPRPSR